MKSPTITITIGCAYCSSAVPFRVESITSKGRGCHVATVACPACDSVFEVRLDTLRKKKGKRLRALEETRAAEREASLARARAANALIAERLLAQPGCTCEMRRATRWDHEGSATSADHWLVSSWSGAIPNVPYHWHRCPCRGSKDEAAIRGDSAEIGTTP